MTLTDRVHYGDMIARFYDLLRLVCFVAFCHFDVCFICSVVMPCLQACCVQCP